MSKEKLTVNELMSLMKSVRDRVASLKAIRQPLTVKERYLWNTGEVKQETEPQYDLKLVDKKIMDLENFLFRADSKIKSVNAKTKVDLEVDADELLKPLE